MASPQGKRRKTLFGATARIFKDTFFPRRRPLSFFLSFFLQYPPSYAWPRGSIYPAALRRALFGRVHVEAKCDFVIFGGGKGQKKWKHVEGAWAATFFSSFDGALALNAPSPKPGTKNKNGLLAHMIKRQHPIPIQLHSLALRRRRRPRRLISPPPSPVEPPIKPVMYVFVRELCSSIN